MLSISADQLQQLLDYPSLVKELEKAFQSDIESPPRHHHEFNSEKQTSSTLLLMPAWSEGGYLGVKIVTISPQNAARAMPTIQGQYLLFKTETGETLAQVDMPVLTNMRTAATSALASIYLSRPNASTLLMVGTGSLAPFMIRAHAAVRPIKHILIWGRNPKKAEKLVETFSSSFQVGLVRDLSAGVKQADLICCATMSDLPLIQGAWLCPGQHIDLVGAYRPSMREVDDDVVKMATCFYDTPQGIYEAGDLAIPIQSGLISEGDLAGNLSDLTSERCMGRTSEDEITLFKSVGHAIEDLMAAKLAYERLTTRLSNA